MAIYEEGYLELIIGPMWAGKTSELVRLHKQFNYCEIPLLAINYKKDNRYSEKNISTHDRIEIPCIRADNLSEISDILNDNLTPEFINAKVILINEGQFFKDIVTWVKKAVDIHNKHVYICGLDGDFKRKAFGVWLNELIPFCNKINKLHSFCGKCKKQPAIFTHRITDNIEQEHISMEDYIPLCRLCYNLNNN